MPHPDDPRFDPNPRINVNPGDFRPTRAAPPQDPVADPPRSRRGWLIVGGVGLLVLGFLIATLFGGDDDADRVASKETLPTITADPTPMKEKPEDPGGMSVPNRDKLVYQRLDDMAEPPRVEKLLPPPEQPLPLPGAGEGGTGTPPMGSAAGTERPADPPMALIPPPAEIASEPPAPKPVDIAPSPAPIAEPAPQAAEPTPPAPTAAVAPLGEGYQIQLLAVRSRGNAERYWEKVRADNADLLGPLTSSVVGTQPSGGLYRLRAGPLASFDAAKAMCTNLKSRRVDCIVIAPRG